MGFGAGALLSAIAYELVPESMLGGWGMAVAFGLGALTFFGGDWVIDRQGGTERKNIGAEEQSQPEASPGGKAAEEQGI